MSTRGKAAAAVASAGVLMIGWQVGASHGQTGVRSASSGGSPSGSASATVPSSAGSTPATAASSGSGASGSFTGDTVDYHYGSIQVTVTLASGTITDVSEIDSPADGRSQQINQQALPLLRSEVLQANSANVSAISGATYTSQGYRQSLQSALDKA